MLEAIANSLPMCVGVGLSPLPIAAVLMMLLSKRAAETALAFLAGWILGIIGVGAVILTVPGIETARGEPTLLSGVLRIVIGVLLLLVAIRQWRTRSATDSAPETPSLLARIDGFRFPQALLTGLLLTVVNPKNLLLTVAGAAAIDAALTDTATMVASLLVFAGIASLTVAMPVLIYFVERERADALFREWKEWLIRNNTTVVLVLLVVFGTILIARGLRVLAAA